MNGRKRGSGFSSPPGLIFPRSWYSHPIICNYIMLMQSRWNGFASRSTMLHSYGTLSKEYTGEKCWQMCGMNPCRCNNKISCPGRQGSMVRYGTRSLTAFFLSSCRARSGLRRSSKRFVFDWLFPHVGE